MIRALALDLDGVVRTWPADPRLAGLYEVAFEPELLHRAVTGVISDEAWRREVAARLGAAGPALVHVWSRLHGVVEDAVMRVVDAYDGPTALLTNATSRLDADLTVLGLAGRFDVVVNSAAVGAAKPDPRSYLALCSALDLFPHEVLFVDDNEAHVDAARRVGIDAHLFTTAASLARVTRA